MKFYATGRRKKAVARVWLMPGEGKITINQRDGESYLTRSTNMKIVEQPLVATGARESYDVWCTAKGGGLSGAFGGGAGSGGAEQIIGGKIGDFLTWLTVSCFVVYLALALGLRWNSSDTTGPESETAEEQVDETDADQTPAEGTTEPEAS